MVIIELAFDCKFRLDTILENKGRTMVRPLLVFFAVYGKI